jgi:outer membrane receptor protein involved in Fe transport
MKHLFLAVIILYSAISYCQPYTQTIKGTISDSDSRIELVGANIFIANTDPAVATISDLNGYFRLDDVPLGRHTILVSYVGYEKLMLQDVLVTSGKEVILDIAMKESVIQVEEVNIIAEQKTQMTLNPMASVSGRRFSVEESKRFAGGFYDPARMAESFAGVSSFGGEGGTNELVIRGNSPRGLLWRLEGIEIPNPNHFPPSEGATGGGVAIITSNIISNSDFLTGAFPAEYGNALSGVFDINLRKGNTEKHEFAFQVSVVGMEGAAEGPFIIENGSYLVNYRLASFRLLDRLGIPVSDNDVVPNFQDFAINLFLPAKKVGRFSLFGFGGTCASGDIAIRDSSKWAFSSDREEMINLHKTGVLGLKHFFSFPNGKTYLRSAVLASYESTSIQMDFLEDDLILKNTYQNSSVYLNYRLSTLLHHKFNSRHSLRSGIIAGSLGSDIHIVTDDDYPENREVYVDYKGRAGTLQAYLQHQFRIPGNIEINSGFHGMIFLLNSNYAIEPRLGLKWNFKPHQTLTAGVGLHSRYEHMSMYTAFYNAPDGTTSRPNLDLDFTKALHNVLGYNVFLLKDMCLSTELYYQYLYNIPIEDSPGSQESILNYSSGFSIHPLSNSGTGRNYGLELTLEKFFTNNYYFLITGSLFDSKYIAGDGEKYNTLYNGNYISNFLGGKEFQVGKSKQNVIGLNTRLLVKGGNRMTPILILESMEKGQAVYDVDRWMEVKAPDYFRWDVGISYRHNKIAYSWIVSMDVQNITDSKNIYRSYYNEETTSIEYIYLQGILPILNFRLEFGL